MSDLPGVDKWITDIRMNRYALPPQATESEMEARHKTIRAIGFLEGFGAFLWTQVGPNLADEAVAEYEKRVADIAEYIGLPPREVDAE